MLVVVLAVIGTVVVLLVGLVALFAAEERGQGPGPADSPSKRPRQTVTDRNDSPSPTGSPAARPQDAVPGPRDDVEITRCTVNDTTDWAEADLLVTNRSSKNSTYLVQVEFVDSTGTRLGNAITSVPDLAPGQRARTTARGLDPITVKITCRITDVTRYAS